MAHSLEYDKSDRYSRQMSATSGYASNWSQRDQTGCRQ